MTLRLCLLLCLLCPAAVADGLWFGQNSSSEDDILDPDLAFRVSAERTDISGQVALRMDIEPGYYLYRDHFRIAADGKTLPLETLDPPAGNVKNDELFGEVQVYDTRTEWMLPLGADMRDLDVMYQGCKEGSICYTPIAKRFSFRADGVDVRELPLEEFAAVAAASPDAPLRKNEADTLMRRFLTGSFPETLGAFFIFGLLLSLTPCVYPMFPILAGMIVRKKGKELADNAFLLSLCFVLAMATTYAVLGIIAGLFQINLQAAAQNRWVIVFFSGVFVLLALSCFGAFHMQMPRFIQNWLHQLMERHQDGNLLGAALMGGLSALIVGPCVTPPLMGALLYISQTGDAMLGGGALWMMGMGFGVPLLLMGASLGKFLPRAGAWMNTVKHLFGAALLAQAVWFLERVLPGSVTGMLWAALLVFGAVFVGAFDSLPTGSGAAPRLRKGLGLLMFFYGVVLMFSLGDGGGLLRPFQGEPQQVKTFDLVLSEQDLDAALAQRKGQGKMMLLNFSADWCVECHQMKRQTFPDPRVRRQLESMVVMEADITEHGARSRGLLRRFELFGPPVMLFFDVDGQELRSMRLTGFVDADQLHQHLLVLLREEG